MAIISVEVPDEIAKKLKSKEVITMDALYDFDQDSSAWQSIKVGEKASTVLDALRAMK